MKRTAVADYENQAQPKPRLLYYFIGRAQLAVMQEIAVGEEGEHIIDKMKEMAAVVETMPKTYEQDGLGDQAVIWLHYFTGSCDWWITEKDTPHDVDGTPCWEQHQAFGLANLGHGGELGYISIKEITAAGAELDLYWTRKTLKEVSHAS